MTIKIKGRYISKNRKNAEYRTFTADEATNFLKDGHYGMISLLRYEIDGVKCSASGLSVGNETFIYERDGKLVVPTYFQRYRLPSSLKSQGDLDDLVMVDVIIEPDDSIFLSIVKPDVELEEA